MERMPNCGPWKSGDPIGKTIHCPMCGQSVIIESGKLHRGPAIPLHRMPTKAEKKAMRTP